MKKQKTEKKYFFALSTLRGVRKSHKDTYNKEQMLVLQITLGNSTYNTDTHITVCVVWRIAVCKLLKGFLSVNLSILMIFLGTS